MIVFEDKKVIEERNNTIDKVIELTHNPDEWCMVFKTIKATKNECINVYNKNVLFDVCCAYLVINNSKKFNEEKHISFLNDKIEKLKKALKDDSYFLSDKTLYRHLRDVIFILIKKCTGKKRGRPKGRGKRTFVYNDKTYTTIQSCANDYNISKQAMHKRLKKANII